MKKTPEHLYKIIAFCQANRRMPSHAKIARAVIHIDADAFFASWSSITSGEH